MYSHACLPPHSNAVAMGPLTISEANYFSLQPKRMEKEIASQGIILFHFDPAFLSAHVTKLYLCISKAYEEISMSWMVCFLLFSHPQNVTSCIAAKIHIRYFLLYTCLEKHRLKVFKEWRSWSVLWWPCAMFEVACLSSKHFAAGDT